MKKLLGFILHAALLSALVPSHAQEPPSKILTIVVPTTPGTGSDIAARLMAPKLSQALGQAVVVENRTGASGTIGIGAVAKAAPDGNTILFVPNTMAMISSLYTNLTWDPVHDFAPVVRIGKMLVAAVVNPALPVETIGDFVALAKKKPGQLNYGTPGTGTPHHLRTEQLRQITDMDVVHIPYKGSAGAVTDLIGGQVQFSLFPLHSVLSMTASGKLKMLATTGDTRSQWTPNVPTFRESGIAGLNNYDWLGVFVPRATPQKTVDRLSRKLLALLDDPDIRKELLARGIIPTPGGPSELATLLSSELDEWRHVIKTAHISAE
ncbi:tripartite tricarboxylate transporter substrate binding protein [Pigmentiphaga sp. GD03639]|uniref:Bug family tripartite tricarboxylate transporter substrate binding protein n=1 Tax=Pigmentiphaga sp. GD03639 TaxID=2975354 RepID=UPI00244BB3AF|nr:tripartite tricarboxylate transporter substrate binding protein [Pigmentiphaga sp. GD03639]MDH2235651.1 tripartite tricarboxylate transporter substrate binding protein [Pigmentiphaga sp. GD03639]